MTQEITSKFLRLESLVDLERLKQGDIVQIKYKCYPYNLNNIFEVMGMYVNSLTENSGRLSFVVFQENYGNPLMLVYKIRPKHALVEDGKLVMHERVSKISQYNKSQPGYYYNFLELLTEHKYFDKKF